MKGLRIYIFVCSITKNLQKKMLSYPSSSLYNKLYSRVCLHYSLPTFSLPAIPLISLSQPECLLVGPVFSQGNNGDHSRLTLDTASWLG